MRTKSIHERVTVTESKNTVESNVQILHLKLAEIAVNGENFRGDVEDARLEELADSIKRYGIINPITVRRVEGQYKIVAGHRRYMAAKKLEMAEVPCIVRELTDEEAVHVQLIENLQRSDIHPLDEAIGYKWLLDRGNTVVEICERVGKAHKYVYGRLRLNDLIAEIREDLRTDWLNLSCALLLANLTEQMQQEVYNEYGYRTVWHGSISAREKQDEWQYTAAELKQRIENYHTYTLKGAPFKLDDASLPGGACNICDKNTGANKYLFADMAEDNARCMDKICFLTKKRLLVERKEAKLEAKEVEVVRISEGWHIDKDMKQTFEEVLTREQFKIVKKEDTGCESEQKGLYVDDKNFNKAVTICTDPKCPIHGKKNYDGSVSATPQKDVDKNFRRKIELISIPEEIEVLRKVFQQLWLSNDFMEIFIDGAKTNELISGKLAAIHVVVDVQKMLPAVIHFLNNFNNSKLLQWLWDSIVMVDENAKAVERQSRLTSWGNLNPENEDDAKILKYTSHAYDTSLKLYRYMYCHKEHIYEHFRALMFATEIVIEGDLVLTSLDNKRFLQWVGNYVDVESIRAEIAPEYDAKREKAKANFIKANGREPVLINNLELTIDNEEEIED